LAVDQRRGDVQDARVSAPAGDGVVEGARQADVAVPGGVGVAVGLSGMRAAGEVNDALGPGFAEELLHGPGVGPVHGMQRDALGQVEHPVGPVATSTHAAHLMVAGAEEVFGEVAAREAGDAGDQDAHGGTLTYYAAACRSGVALPRRRAMSANT